MDMGAEEGLAGAGAVGLGVLGGEVDTEGTVTCRRVGWHQRVPLPLETDLYTLSTNPCPRVAASSNLVPLPMSPFKHTDDPYFFLEVLPPHRADCGEFEGPLSFFGVIDVEEEPVSRS